MSHVEMLEIKGNFGLWVFEAASKNELQSTLWSYKFTADRLYEFHQMVPSLMGTSPHAAVNLYDTPVYALYTEPSGWGNATQAVDSPCSHEREKRFSVKNSIGISTPE